MKPALSCAWTTVFSSARRTPARPRSARAGRDRLDDLQQRHHLRRVEEVQAQEALRALGRRRLVDDGERRGVGGEQRLLLDDPVELPPHLELGVEVLGDRLDHQVAVGELGVVERPVDAARSRRPPGTAPSAPSRPRARAASRSCRALVERLLVDLADDDLEARLRRDLGDAVAHQPAAQNADLRDVRHSFLLSGKEGGSLHSRRSWRPCCTSIRAPRRSSRSTATRSPPSTSCWSGSSRAASPTSHACCACCAVPTRSSAGGPRGTPSSRSRSPGSRASRRC